MKELNFKNFDVIYQLCNEQGWCTSATVESYNKILDLAREEVSIDIISSMIWSVTSGSNLELIESYIRDSEYVESNEPIQKIELEIANKIHNNIERNNKEDEHFKYELNDFLSNSDRKKDIPIIIGRTPYSLISIGADANLNIIIRPDTIVKCMREAAEEEHGHALTQKMLEVIPREIRNPVMILKGSHEGSIVLISQIKDIEDREVIIAVELIF